MRNNQVRINVTSEAVLEMLKEKMSGDVRIAACGEPTSLSVNNDRQIITLVYTCAASSRVGEGGDLPGTGWLITTQDIQS